VCGTFRNPILSNGLLPLSFLLVLSSAAHAERLPVKTYTTADGLAGDKVMCIVPDSRGFLWICTAEGLSRFDGYEFTNYTTGQGLPTNVVYDLLETRQGTYWLATPRGPYRLDPSSSGSLIGPFRQQEPGPRFTLYPLGSDSTSLAANTLIEDLAGTIWFDLDGWRHRLAQAHALQAVGLVQFPLGDPDTTGRPDQEGEIEFRGAGQPSRMTFTLRFFYVLVWIGTPPPLLLGDAVLGSTQMSHVPWVSRSVGTTSTSRMALSKPGPLAYAQFRPSAPDILDLYPFWEQEYNHSVLHGTWP
jgi:hypothetical protein